MYLSYTVKRETEDAYTELAGVEAAAQALATAADDAFRAATTAKDASDKLARDAARAAVAAEYRTSSDDREYAKLLLQDFKD